MQELENRVVLSVPVGAEFLVNSVIPGSQVNPSVAMDQNGNSVVVWSGPVAGPTGNGVFGQRFDAVGNKVGGEFRIDTTPVNYSYSIPKVAMDADGDFVVTWNNYGLDGSGEGISARRYDSSGVAKDATEFLVNQAGGGQQLWPVIACDDAGNFVITWKAGGIWARRYDAGGTPLGNEFRVDMSGGSMSPWVSMDATGNMLFAWEDYDGSGYGIEARRFDSAGVAISPDIRVNTYITNDQRNPTVAIAPDSRFVVVWMSLGQDGSDWGSYGQFFNADGSQRGPEFRINNYTAGYQRHPNCDYDGSGNLVVTWLGVGADDADSGIYRVEYDPAGTRMGDDVRVNTSVPGQQWASTVACRPNGDSIVAWHGPGPGDSSGGIYAQRFTSNVAPTTSGLAAVVVDEDAANTEVDLWAAFADANDPDPTLIYTVESNSNIGLFASTLIDPLTGKLALDYAADQNGAAALVIRATDPLGLWVETTLSVTVKPVNDLPRLQGMTLTPDRLIENQSTHLSGMIVDPDLLDAFTLMVDWGDGFFEIVPMTQADPTISRNHPYRDDPATPGDAYTVRITVIDSMGGMDWFNPTLVVENAAPTITGPLGPAYAVRSSPVVFNGAFTDPGPLDTFEVKWDFGDGTIIDFHPSTDPGATTPSHVYGTSGTYEVKYTVRDDDGGVAEAEMYLGIGATSQVGGVLYVGGTPGNDYINISPCKGTSVFFAAARLYASYNGVNKVVVYGGEGHDYIDVTADYPREAELWGGNGNDSILGGLAGDVLMGQEGDDRLDSRGGADILIGGNGADRARGGVDRDLLIAGAGNDTLYGDAGEDILVACGSTHDNDLDSLKSIRSEWTSARSYAVRTANIRDGSGSGDGVNGSAFLRDGATVFDDNTPDLLCGGYDTFTDWFFADKSSGDQFMDLRPGETVDVLFS